MKRRLAPKSFVLGAGGIAVGLLPAACDAMSRIPGTAEVLSGGSVDNAGNRRRTARWSSSTPSRSGRAGTPAAWRAPRSPWDQSAPQDNISARKKL